MEARAGNSILDFETLFSDFQELLNGSGLKVAKGIVQPKFINDGRSFAECYVGLFWQQFLTNFLESV